MDTETRSIHSFKEGDLFDNRYRLVSLAGSGGFADVWRAEDTLRKNKVVALKIYSRLDADSIAEMSEEYSATEELQHPNLLTGNHFAAVGNIPYLEMRYCEGGNLSQKIGKMPADELRSMLRDVCSGLAYLHSEGIVHQDIKPENILFDTQRKRYMLADFGISAKSRSRLSKSAKMTGDVVALTAAYAPPEKLSANPADRIPSSKGDIFSLGLTLYELATGSLPVDLPQSTGHLLLMSDGRQELFFDNIADSTLRAITKRCLQFAKEDRPSASEILAMFNEDSAGSGLAAETAVPHGRKTTKVKNENNNPPSNSQSPATMVPPLTSRKWIYVVAAVVAAVLVGALLFALPKGEPSDAGVADTAWVAVSESQAELTPVEKEDAAAPQSGTLGVSSSPTGAAVKVDGKYRGSTPLTIEGLAPGRYEVVVSAEGYESHTWTMQVKAGKTTSCHADLKKVATAAAQPAPSALNVASVNPSVHSPASQSASTSAGVRMEGNTLVFTSDGAEHRYRMVYVGGGSYTMGCTSEQGDDCKDWEKPAHSVSVGSFYMGQTEVTQALWKAVMGSNPSHREGNNLPVEKVSWNDCQEFIRKLNSLTGRSFRLPTEEEWEYAARGGGSSRGHKYSGSNNLGSVAWYDDNSGSRTHPVGQKHANELGLYDMSGNVWEWCSSGWSDDYSSARSGSIRVVRGGGWSFSARRCRVSCRDNRALDHRLDYDGLRLVLSSR